VLGRYGQRPLPRQGVSAHGRRRPTAGFTRQERWSPCHAHAAHSQSGPTPAGASSFLLFPLPRPLAVLTRDEGDQTSAGQRSHLEITRRHQKMVRVDSAHLLRGRQFPKLAPTRSRGHWCWYRLGGWKPGPHRCPEWFPVRHHGTAGRARPAAAVYPFTDRASPHCAHPGGRSVRFRTSFPTRRPARPDPVVGDR
jgi:hypothetical protein